MATSRHLPAEQRRAATIESVISLAAQGDPAAITTAAIAAHMGVTQGALFRQFANKEAILEAVMGWVADRLLGRIAAAASAATSPAGAIEAMFMAHVAFVTEHPGVPRMLFGELQRSEMTAPKRAARVLLKRYGMLVRERIEAGQAAGEFDAELDVEAAVVAYIGTLQGLVMQSLLAGDVARVQQDAPRVFALYLRALGTRT